MLREYVGKSLGRFQKKKKKKIISVSFTSNYLTTFDKTDD